jgi:hypothetical protein
MKSTLPSADSHGSSYSLNGLINDQDLRWIEKSEGYLNVGFRHAGGRCHFKQVGDHALTSFLKVELDGSHNALLFKDENVSYSRVILVAQTDLV